MSYVEKVRKLQEAADVIDSIPRTAETSEFLILFLARLKRQYFSWTAVTSLFLVLFFTVFPWIANWYFLQSWKFLALFVVKKEETTFSVEILCRLQNFHHGNVEMWICRFSIKFCFRSESTLKSIKLQYGAEIDGWRAKYEEAQVKIEKQNIKSNQN